MQALVYLLSVMLLTSSDNYFSRVTMASDGRITRFPYTPVSVYTADPPVPEGLKQTYIEDVEYALAQWEGCSEGQLRFKRVDSKDADIRIYWTTDPLSGESDPLGEASLIKFDSGKFYVKISILLKGMPSSATSIHRELRAVLLHEIGHSIGLWGHSEDPNDVMYFRNRAISPSRQDKDTLLRVLSLPHGTPLHKNAIAELKSDISKDPDSAHLHLWLGSVYADEGSEDSAIEELTTALKLDRDILRASDRLGRIFQKEGMYKKAIAYYSKEAELEPSAGLCGIIGTLKLRQKDYASAIDYFQKALSLDNNFSPARTNALVAYHQWAEDLIRTGKPDSAILVMRRALELFPSSRVVHYDLGTAYEVGGQYEKAIEHYKKALEVEPSFTSARSNIAACMNNLSVKHMRNGSWESAIELCKQALKWDPDCWEARKNLESATLELGMEKHKSGLLDEAISCYNAILKMNPNNISAHVNIGDVFCKKGMYKDAQEHFQSALNIDPGFYDAKAGLDMVKRHVNANRAKIIALLTIISMLLCSVAILLYRYLQCKKMAGS